MPEQPLDLAFSAHCGIRSLSEHHLCKSPHAVLIHGQKELKLETLATKNPSTMEKQKVLPDRRSCCLEVMIASCQTFQSFEPWKPRPVHPEESTDLAARPAGLKGR